MNLIVVDTETTGLGIQKGRQDAIVQIGAVALMDGSIRSTFSEFCWPGDHYFAHGRAAAALAVSGIDEGELRTARPCSGVASSFTSWLGEQLPATITAYNIAFDSPFLDAPPWSIGLVEGLEWGKCVMIEVSECLGEMGHNRRHPRYGNWKWVRLSNAARIVGIELSDAHDALADATAAAELIIKLGLDI